MGTELWVSLMPERSNGVPSRAEKEIVCLTPERVWALSEEELRAFDYIIACDRVEIREPVETAVDLAVATCDGDPRAAIRALIILVGHLEQELSRARADISRGYVRGRNVTPR
jgi:hypothetical protein